MEQIILMNCSLCNNAGILRKEGEDSIMCPMCKGVNMRNKPKPQKLTNEQCEFIRKQMNSMTNDLSPDYTNEKVQEDWVKYWRSTKEFRYFPVTKF